MSDKIFKATLESKSTQHPEGKKSVIVIVRDKMKKDAVIKAQDELKFWDVENHELYKNPKMEELPSEDGEQAILDYLSVKEEQGQCEIEEGESTDTEELSAVDFDASEQLKKIKRTVVNHADYKNCSDPWDPSDFINGVIGNFESAYSEHGSKICADVVAGVIEEMKDISNLNKKAFVNSEVISVALSAHENTQKLMEPCIGAVECEELFVKAGPGAPDYSKSKDKFIERSKHKISEDTVFIVGVGHNEGKFLASYEFCLVEKDTGVLATTHGSISNFADKTFSCRANAISFAFGMVIDRLTVMAESLNKQLMHSDAKRIEAHADKIQKSDLIELFEKNLSATTLPIIESFCTMPSGESVEQESEIDQSWFNFVKSITDQRKETPTPDEMVLMATNVMNAFSEHEIELLEDEFYTREASAIMGLCRFGDEPITSELSGYDNTLMIIRDALEIDTEEPVKKETKPAQEPEVKPQAPAETKPVIEPETKPMTAPETKEFNIDELEISNEGDQPQEPEISELELEISELNDRIEKLEPGEILVLDDISNAAYHGSKGISSTKVKDACVSLMYFNGIHNTGEIEKPTGTHFNVGNLAHTLILEPEKVELEYKKKPDMPEPTQPQQEKYKAWVKDGKPENQNLKPNDKIIAAVDAWVKDGKPENQSLKPADAVIEKVEAYLADADNNPAPTAKQQESFDAWSDAGKPEPYKGKPTDKQLEKYNAWADAGKPEPYSGAPSDIAIERCEFWEEFLAENQGVIIVDEDNWKIAEDMASAVLADEFAGRILGHSSRKSECSYLKVDEETGLLVKVRTDIDVGGLIGDVKTIQLRGNPDEEWLLSELRREVKRRKYDLSAAMYLDVSGKRDFVWVWVNKEPGYHWVAVVKASQETLSEGYDKYRSKLNSISNAYKTNVWPKPASIQKVLNNDTNKFELPEI